MNKLFPRYDTTAYLGPLLKIVYCAKWVVFSNSVTYITTLSTPQKRWQEFADVLKDFNDIGPIRVLKHCTTRWLSLERSVKRLIALWPALHCYFDRESEGAANERLKRVAALLGSVETKLFVHFVAPSEQLQYCIPGKDHKDWHYAAVC